MLVSKDNPPNPTPSSPKRSDSLPRNILLSVAVYGLSILLALFVSPTLIRTLGDARYGIWSLIAEVTGYYGLLDFGIRGAVGFFVARFLSTKNSDELNRVVSTGFWGLAGVGLIVSSIGSLVAFIFPEWFAVAQVSTSEMQITMLIMAVTIGMSLPTEMLGSVLNGYKRLDLLSSVELVTRLANAAAIVVALKSGGGLIHLSLIQFGTKLVAGSLNYILVRRLAPELDFHPRGLNKGSLKLLAGFGAQNMVVAIGQMLTTRSDLMMVGAFLNIRLVTNFNLGRMMVEYCYSGIRTMTLAFTMHLTHAYGAGKIDETIRLYLIGTRLSGLVGALLTAYILAFGKSFLGLWVGAAYVTTVWTERSDIVMSILILGYLPRMLHSITHQLMVAAKQVGFMAKVTVIEAITKVILSIVLVKPFGLAGVALGSAIPSTILFMFIVTRRLFQIVPLTPGRYIRKGLARPLICGFLVLLCSKALVEVQPPHNWFLFFSETSFALLLGGIIIALIGLDKEERSRALGRATGYASAVARRVGV